MKTQIEKLIEIGALINETDFSDKMGWKLKTITNYYAKKNDNILPKRVRYKNQWYYVLNDIDRYWEEVAKKKGQANKEYYMSNDELKKLLKEDRKRGFQGV